MERLENRSLLTIYNPQPATPLTPGPVEGTPLAADIILATFDSFDPAAGLTASVSFNGGSAIAANVVRTPGNGTEFVPGVGTVPQYFVQLPANSYTPPQAGAGALSYVLTVQDSADASWGSIAAGSDVKDAPVTLVSTNGALAATAGTPLVGQSLAVFSDLSPGATVASFLGSIDWGDGTAPSPATFVSLGGGQFGVQGSHTYSAPLTTNISITVDDLAGSKVVALTGPVTVANAAIDSPTPILVSGKQGELLNNVPLLRFVSHNPLALAGMFTAQINWGDGNTSLGTVTRVGGGVFSSIFQVTGSNTYTTTSGSPFPITLNVSDLFGGSLPTQTTSATITQPALNVSVLSFNANVGENAGLGDTLAIVNDLSGSHPAAGYTAEINWGDGSPNQFVDGADFIQDFGGTFDVPSPGHSYTGPGLFPITVTVNNGEEAIGSGGGFALVNNPAGTSLDPVPVGPISSVEGSPIPANSTVGRFVIGGTTATTAGLSAVIDWGDGTPTALGTIVPAGSTPTSATFDVTGNHVYARLGTYTITTTFTDGAHQTATTTTVSHVADAPIGSGTGVPVLGQVGQSLVNVPVATFVDPNRLAHATDFTALIHWGDGSVTSGTVTAIGAASGGGVLFSVSGSHAYLSPSADGAPLTITTNVAEAANAANALAIPSTATILAPAPTPVAPSSIGVSVFPQIAVARTPVSLPATTIVATFHDTSGLHAVGSYKVTIAWGDGKLTNNATIVSLGGGTFAVLAGHTYRLKGLYPIRIAVRATDPVTQKPATGFGANLVTVNPRHRARRVDVQNRELSGVHLQARPHGGSRAGS